MRRIALASIVLLATLASAAPMAGAGNQNASSVVPPEKLLALLPQIPGWTRGEPSSELVTTGMTMSVARVTYEKGESSISLEIMDTAKNQMLLAPFTMLMKSGFMEKTGQGYRKGTTIAGLPGLEAWDPEGPTADVAVLVAERFLVKATASEVPDTTAARKAVEAVDFKALASLK